MQARWCRQVYIHQPDSIREDMVPDQVLVSIQNLCIMSSCLCLGTPLDLWSLISFCKAHQDLGVHRSELYSITFLSKKEKKYYKEVKERLFKKCSVAVQPLSNDLIPVVQLRDLSTNEFCTYFENAPDLPINFCNICRNYQKYG